MGLRDAEDGDNWKHALATGAAIITKDEDFAIRAQQTDASPAIVWLRIGNTSNHALRLWLMPQLPLIIGWIEQGVRVLEVR